MKGKLIIISIGAAAIAVAGYAIAVKAAEAPAHNELAAAVQYVESRFVLKNSGGQLAVFSENADMPDIETEIDISGLREYDRELLERGIEVDSYEQILGLLEDFSN